MKLEIKNAFESGYEEVKKIPEERLFLWMGKFVYGVLYNDLVLEISRSKKRPNGKEFKLSPYFETQVCKVSPHASIFNRSNGI